MLFLSTPSFHLHTVNHSFIPSLIHHGSEQHCPNRHIRITQAHLASQSRTCPSVSSPSTLKKTLETSTNANIPQRHLPQAFQPHSPHRSQAFRNRIVSRNFSRAPLQLLTRVRNTSQFGASPARSVWANRSFDVKKTQAGTHPRPRPNA